MVMLLSSKNGITKKFGRSRYQRDLFLIQCDCFSLYAVPYAMHLCKGGYEIVH